MKNLSLHYANHVPKYMSCHKALVVITWFHNYISAMPILLLGDLGTLSVVDH